MDILTQPLVFAPVVDVAAQGRRMLYEYGKDAYSKGYCLDTLSSAEARKGWMAALDAQAECNTPGYAQRMGW